MVKHDPRINDYFRKLPTWQHEACKKLRDIIHKADSEIEETIKRTDRPYFTLEGNVCAIQATKDHINLFIYDPIAEDKEKVINQGEGNLTARSVQIYRDSEINESGLLSLLRAVVANNRAGGWRKLR